MISSLAPRLALADSSPGITPSSTEPQASLNSPSAPASSKTKKPTKKSCANTSFPNSTPTNSQNIPLLYENEDLVLDVLNPAHMEVAYQYANQTIFQDEKQEYMKMLHNRIASIDSMDNRNIMNSSEKLQSKYLNMYTNKAENLRNQAAKELYPVAMGNVMKLEELIEVEGKKLHRNLQKKERRAQRAAALKVQKAKFEEASNIQAEAEKLAVIAKEEGKKPLKSKSQSSRSKSAAEDSATDTTAKSKSKRSKAKNSNTPDPSNDSSTEKSETSKSKSKSKSRTDSSRGGHALSLAPADDDDTDSHTDRFKSGTKGASSTTSKDKKESETKSNPPPKPPSQKEIRAIARLYQNTYDSVWKDMARRDANRVHRTVQSSNNTRQANLRKTAVLASKEARRWQFKTNKNIKDLQMKARRGMREMLAFWKKNEREERELRKKAEKEAMEQAKKEEEQRESRRQARKLNFLISQTELYTHFIGRKIDDTETAPQLPAVGFNTVPDGKVGTKDLDFDSDNEEEINRVAMENARSAFAETQAHARNFNGDEDSTRGKNVNIDSDEMNFQNPTSLGDITIPQPKLLSCKLKEYQIKGLSWLANLYEQGINGILADEMGLGKTVQSISVMAYLAETYGIWGPFLVISPASTLHNWKQEIAKFVPDFKVLPYWGNAKDRKVLRKFWDHKNVKYTKDSEFHVLVTSYQLVVADAPYFQKMRWQYMILDEAQAIKSSTSARWKSLLSFHCRNRLLLTGTPIQNSMQELWALLHFIMPTLFDSHDEFSEWFSKDIESHAQSNTQLNEQQLTRLHMILKPFMLRRLKKHVQQELGDKIEIDVYCELTNRQRAFYNTLRSQISVMDLIEKAASGSDENTQSLMNLVMQFRKVCNHPDLFERADVSSAFLFSVPSITFGPIRESKDFEILYNNQNLISYNVPKQMYRDGGFLDVPNYANDSYSITKRFLENQFSIWNPDNVASSSTMRFTRLIGSSPNQAEFAAKNGVFERAINLHSCSSPVTAAAYDIIYDENDKYTPIWKMLLISERNDKQEHSKVYSSGVMHELFSVGQRILDDGVFNYVEPAYEDRVQAPPINFYASDQSVVLDQNRFLFNESVRSCLFPMTLDQEWDHIQHGAGISELPVSNMFPWARNNRMGFTTITMPSMDKFVADSGKLTKLDQMLPELKANDHRVLIYFQMTKMMDLMEEYLTFRQYKYCRLDGSSKLSDRRDLVNDWQTKPELFVFLLSTRAGGLGINLTAADTVIFYDSDWNPTIDSQAMDRAHRMGQTRQVTVYRLLVKGTIEERMRDRAKQKMHVQQVVMEGGGSVGSKPIDFQKPGREVAYWLLDDDATADALINRKQEESSANRKDKKESNKRGASAAGIGTAMANGNGPTSKRQKVKGIEDMYHEDEGNFDESSAVASAAPSGTVTPVTSSVMSKRGPTKRRNGN